jgi:HSP20 family protein
LEPQRKERAQSLRRLQNDMDRMVLELMGADRMLGCPPHAFRPNMDVYYSKAAGAMIVELELAGVDPDSVRLEAHDRVLRVRGQRVHRSAADKVYQQMEIPYGPFERRVHLPLEVDANEATAQFEDGFLRITLPVAPAPEARRIPINQRGGVEDGPIEPPTSDPKEA